MGTEVQVLGRGLKDLPRDQIVVATKVGRYGQDTFDFSAARVKASVRESLARLQVLYTRSFLDPVTWTLFIQFSVNTITLCYSNPCAIKKCRGLMDGKERAGSTETSKAAGPFNMRLLVPTI